MKKQLLFGFAAFAALAVTAQNSRKITTDLTVKKMETFKPLQAVEGLSRPSSPVSNSTSQKVAVSVKKRIGGSTNAYGVQSVEGRALTYNAGINTIGMVMRKEAGWAGVTGGNSGTVVYTYSKDGGATWDSTILIANATKLMRHPGGTIYNPVGNTTPANAYAVASGPWHPGSNWQGDYFGSKQLTFPGNSTTGTALFVDNLSLATTPGQVKQDFARCDMQASTNGKVHVLGGLYENISGTTAATQKFRGAIVNTGTFNAGTFTWTVDSLKPNFKVNTAGAKQGFSQFNQAWSEDGQTGYVIFDGVDANAVAGTSSNTYQLYVYKTSNGGASWARHAPLYDFSSIPQVGDRTYPAKVINKPKPWISMGEGSCGTVDANGQLHFIATFGSSASDNIDSLGYTYNVNFKTTWNYITDFYTTNTGWCAIVLDSLTTDGPAATDAGAWSSSTGGVGYDARLQISRTTDGQKLFYSWVDSDTLVTGTHLNTLPDVHMKGYDLATNMLTMTKNMSTGKPGNYNSFWFLSSPIVAVPSAGVYQIPTIYTNGDDGTNNGDNPVSYYYMNDNTFATADFNVMYTGGCTPTNVKQLAINNTLENLNFYPNPASHNGTIDVQLNESAKLDVSILNAVGQTVYSTSVNGNLGSNKVDVNLSNLSSGLYFYQVKIGNSKAVTKKFAVEK